MDRKLTLLKNEEHTSGVYLTIIVHPAIKSLFIIKLQPCELIENDKP